jgi:hypothetical protein
MFGTKTPVAFAVKLLKLSELFRQSHFCQQSIDSLLDISCLPSRTSVSLS